MKDKDIQMLVMCLVICFIAWFTSSDDTCSSIKPSLYAHYAEPARESSEMILYRLFGDRVFGRTKRRKSIARIVKKSWRLS